MQADPTLQPVGLGPILLHARDARRGRVVAAANAAARAMGIVPHMQLSQASTLCPNAELIEHDPQADIECLSSLAESAQCFSPIVGIEQLDPLLWAGRSLHQPQSILLDVTGIAPLFDGEARLAAAVHQWIKDQGYTPSIAIADAIGTAWALANYAHRSMFTHPDRFLRVVEVDVPTPARDKKAMPTTASVKQEVLAVTILAEDAPAGIAIYPLSIDALRLDQATVAKLHRLGIRKIGQLIELPRSGLASRFDEHLLKRIDQTLHHRIEPIVSLHASPELAIQECLEHPTPLRTTIDAIVQKQIHRLTRVLSDMGHGVLRLVCRIEMELNAIPIEADENDSATKPPPLARIFQIGLYQPSQDPEHLLWLLTGQLDSHYSQGPSYYWARSISVAATLTAPLSWKQNDLFDRHTTTHRDAIAKLVDSLSARLGRAAVVAPTLQRDPQPELAYAWRPLTGLRRDGTKQETKRKLARAPKRDFSEQKSLEPNSNDLWRRPMRLLQPPKRIDVQRVDASGAPTRLVHNGSPLAVSCATAVERIDTGWWQGATQQRDYYRIALSTGVWLWIYRDRRDQQWYLHGEFD